MDMLAAYVVLQRMYIFKVFFGSFLRTYYLFFFTSYFICKFYSLEHIQLQVFYRT
jgi:hypothetical protein